MIAATTSPFTESPSTEALPAPHAAMGDFEAVFDDGRATEDDLKPAAVLHDTVSTFERAALPEEPEAIALEREWEPESVAAATGEGARLMRRTSWRRRRGGLRRGPRRR